MAITVDVPRNLSAIKTKVAFNLTKRQLICFSAAGAVGIPLYLFTKPHIGTEAAAMIMMAVTLPLFFLAMFERDGFPAEKYLGLVMRQKFLAPGIRRYKSEGIYRKMEDIEKMKKEASGLEHKRRMHGKRGQGKARKIEKLCR